MQRKRIKDRLKKIMLKKKKGGERKGGRVHGKDGEGKKSCTKNKTECDGASVHKARHPSPPCTGLREVKGLTALPHQTIYHYTVVVAETGLRESVLGASLWRKVTHE